MAIGSIGFGRTSTDTAEKTLDVSWITWLKGRTDLQVLSIVTKGGGVTFSFPESSKNDR